MTLDDATELPFVLMDLIEKVYEAFVTKPKIVTGEVRLEPVNPFKSVAIYPVTVLPTGGVKLRVTLEFVLLASECSV